MPSFHTRIKTTACRIGNTTISCCACSRSTYDLGRGTLQMICTFHAGKTIACWIGSYAALCRCTCGRASLLFKIIPYSVIVFKEKSFLGALVPTSTDYCPFIRNIDAEAKVTLICVFVQGKRWCCLPCSTIVLEDERFLCFVCTYYCILIGKSNTVSKVFLPHVLVQGKRRCCVPCCSTIVLEEESFLGIVCTYYRPLISKR